MNDNNPHQIARTQRSVFYVSAYPHSDVPDPYTHMFLEDVGLGIFPIGGESRRSGFSVKILPPNPSTTKIIVSALKQHSSGASIGETLWEFFRLLSAEICAVGSATYEIAYLEDRQTTQIIGFDLFFIRADQLIRKGKRIFQRVPPEIAATRNLPERIELAAEDIVVFKPPAVFESILVDVRQNLQQLGKLQFPSLLLESVQKSIPYDLKAYHRAQKLALVETMRKIGWNARGTFNDQVLSYYWIRLELSFERFKIALRDAMLSTLNETLKRAGSKAGFTACITIEGLPTVEEVQEALIQLDAGTKPFTEIMKPFEIHR